MARCLWHSEAALWQQLNQGSDPDSAARLVVEALYIAATQDQEATVAAYLQQQLATGTLTLPRLQQQFQARIESPAVPEIASIQHDLSSYDQFLSLPTNNDAVREPDHAAQTAQTEPLPERMADHRTPSHRRIGRMHNFS